MALEDLLTALEAQAAAEAAELEHDAREEARAIVEGARREARALTERAARADEHDLELDLAQRRAAVRLAVAATLRETREETFRTLVTAVHMRLTTLRASAGYPEMLRYAIEESLAALPTATALRVDPRDERLAIALLEQLGARLSVVATLETAGGVEVVGPDGRNVRNTLEERFSNAEPALRLLFGRTVAEDSPAPDTTTGGAA
jgi:vacuolar-type H+-ATPase subunit E/Vma4